MSLYKYQYMTGDDRFSGRTGGQALWQSYHVVHFKHFIKEMLSPSIEMEIGLLTYFVNSFFAYETIFRVALPVTYELIKWNILKVQISTVIGCWFVRFIGFPEIICHWFTGACNPLRTIQVVRCIYIVTIDPVSTVVLYK